MHAGPGAESTGAAVVPTSFEVIDGVQFHNTEVQGMRGAMTALSGTAAVVCYEDNASRGRCSFLRVDSDALQVNGDSIPINAGGAASPIAVTRMSDTSAAVCYRDEDGKGECRFLTVPGHTYGLSLQAVSTTMELGPPIGSGSSGRYTSLARLSDTTAAWCYTEVDDDDAACKELRLVDGSNEWEAASELVRFSDYGNTGGKTLHLAVAGLTASTAAVCYSVKPVATDESSECTVVSFSETTSGPAVPLATAETHYLSMAPLSSTAAALCYADGSNGFKATCHTLTTATEGGDEPAIGAPMVHSEGEGTYTSLTVLSDSTAMLCYRDMHNGGQGQCLPLNGHGDGTLQPGCPAKVGSNPEHLSSAALSRTRSIVCFNDDLHKVGKCRLLSGITLTECPAPEFVSTLAPAPGSPPPSHPPPPPLAPDVVIANDPMFVVNGVHRHFWLPTGKLTPLLSWATSRGTSLMRQPKNGSRLVLSGETFGHGPTQWFGTYVLTSDDREVLRLSIDEARSIADEAGTPSSPKLRTLRLWLDGKLVTDQNTLSASSLVRGLTVRATALPGPHVGATPAEVAEIVAPGLHLAITSSSAKKYSREAAQVRWAHLNLHIKGALPADAEGTVAELAELRPLSAQTMGYLAVPKLVAQHRVHKRTRAKRAQLDKVEASALLARAPDEITSAGGAPAI